MLRAAQTAVLETAPGEVLAGSEDASHCSRRSRSRSWPRPCFLARAAKLAGRDDLGTAELQLCASRSPSCFSFLWACG